MWMLIGIFKEKILIRGVIYCRNNPNAHCIQSCWACYGQLPVFMQTKAKHTRTQKQHEVLFLKGDLG